MPFWGFRYSDTVGGHSLGGYKSGHCAPRRTFTEMACEKDVISVRIFLFLFPSVCACPIEHLIRTLSTRRFFPIPYINYHPNFQHPGKMAIVTNTAPPPRTPHPQEKGALYIFYLPKQVASNKSYLPLKHWKCANRSYFLCYHQIILAIEVGQWRKMGGWLFMDCPNIFLAVQSRSWHGQIFSAGPLCLWAGPSATSPRTQIQGQCQNRNQIFTSFFLQSPKTK